ncbi:hypothetical protein K491DRAFT_692353 [Lophiostoma macrostomum CBS 122681]|uniref:Uncharacterized protein n=1 Tax=Lophiostoma macrostomum CBS 122681 TaxID=1314788 RepID=A0A6A6TC16_9PLEO|nr:hypothetical protein K491DRAFT_692353 [Lophiostoma macrostomum CBS 122681]
MDAVVGIIAALGHIVNMVLVFLFIIAPLMDSATNIIESILSAFLLSQARGPETQC